MLQQPMATDDNRLSLTCMTHWYGNPMHRFFGRDTRITILEGPFTSQRGWVDSIAFRKPDGSDERAFCYQTTLESGKWVTIRWDHVAPGWLSDDDLTWLLERLPRLTFSID
jgi:hypothetical protein